MFPNGWNVDLREDKWIFIHAAEDNEKVTGDGVQSAVMSIGFGRENG